MAGPPAPQKLCPSCGASVGSEANVCSNCGYNFNTGPFAQPPSPSYGAYPPAGMPPQGYRDPTWQANYPRPGYGEAGGAGDGLAIAALVLGIVSIPGICLYCFGLPCAILALIFGAFGLKGRNRGMAIAGMICGGFAIVATIVFILIFAIGSSGSRWP